MISNREQERTLSVIIPAYNEEQRLKPTIRDLFAYFRQEQSGFHLLEVLIVDDGSTDKTLDLIADLKREFPLIRLVHLNGNQGKGAAVKAGLMKAQGQWFLIADADQSTPWKEMEILLREALTRGADMAMGSRALNSELVEIHQAWWREGMGKFFNWIVRSMFGLVFLDTQCGFKLLKNFAQIQSVISDLRIRRFAWDVELILALQDRDKKIVEIPVTWRNKLDSRVHPIRDSFEMLFQLSKIRILRIFKR